MEQLSHSVFVAPRTAQEIEQPLILRLAGDFVATFATYGAFGLCLRICSLL